MNLAYGHELGKNNARDIPIDTVTRLKSTYVIGSSGSGKSSLLETWIHQDIESGTGFAVFDVEDRLSSRTLRHLCDAGREPVIIDPARGAVPLNVLAVPPGVHPHTIIEGCLQTFQRFWFDSWGPRTEDILRHSLMLLIDQGLTLGELPRLLSNQAFRERVAESSEDERVRLFFLDHLRGISGREYRTWIEAVRNKVASLMSNPFLAPCLSTDECLDFLQVMDSGTPLIVNLNEKVLGDSGRILGALIISRLFQVALRREPGARPFILYLDEFQTLTTRSLLDLITRSRKRGLGCVLAHQTCSQPPFDRNPDFLSTILGNVATTVVMQIGREDAERFAKEVFPAHGVQAKRQKKHWLWGSYGDPQFYSVVEEREQQMDELQEQHPRECVIRVKEGEGRRIFVCSAYDLPEPICPEEEAEDFTTVCFSRLAVSPEAVSALHEARVARFSPRRRGRPVDDEPID